MADNTSFSRRDFLKTLSVGAAVALFPIACSYKEAEVGEDGSVDEVFGDATVYTRNDPGAWGGKQDSHVPEAILTKLDEAGNYRVDVTVQHEMVPSHWIKQIWLRNGKKEILAEKVLQPSDPAPAQASFTANVNNVEKFVVYELCNLHGLWMAEYAIPTA